MFDPGLKIGQILRNAELSETFKCGNMGGMRRSRATNTLVLISDYTKGLYHDKWIGGVLHYTGMGKNGDQDINQAQNATLANYGLNGVDVHLFEVIDAGQYIYCGRIELVEKPYIDIQRGEDGHERKVWMFPIRPVPENDVRKPRLLVFRDMADYIARGKDVDAEYTRLIAAERDAARRARVVVTPPVVVPVVHPAPAPVIPVGVLGKTVRHKAFGTGVVTGINGTTITVNFDTTGVKCLGYEVCIKNKLLVVQ